MTRSARNGTLFENRFLFGTVLGDFSLNPSESARITIFESGNLGLSCEINRRV